MSFTLGIVSAIATVVFHDNDETSVKTYLMILTAVISGLSAFSCLNAVEWLKKTTEKIGKLTEKLSLEEIHFVEAGRKRGGTNRRRLSTSTGRMKTCVAGSFWS